MRRREHLIFLAGLFAATRARAQRAQAQARGRLPVVGFLGFASEEADRPQLAALRQGLAEQGHIDGETISVMARHAGGDLSVAARLIDEMVRRPVDVFVAPGPAAARSIRRATTIPIVANGLPPTAGDHDLFASLAKPGGTITGFSHFGEDLSAKRIEVLREVLPKASVLGILHNATDPVFRDWGVRTEASARAQGLEPIRLGLRSGAPDEAPGLLRSLRNQGGDGVIVVSDFLTHTLKAEIIRTAGDLGIAVIAEHATFAESGALISYGANIPDLLRRAAAYVDRIIKGEKAGDLPIQLPTKFTLTINLKTARALNLALPPALLARADEVLE